MRCILGVKRADCNARLDTEVDVWLMPQIRDSGLWVDRDAFIQEGLASCGNLVREPFPFPVCTRERTWKLHARLEFGGQSCRGGREPGPVQLRPKLERLGRADWPHPAHPGAAGCWRTSDLSSFAQPLTPRAAAACGVLPPPHLVLRLVVPVRNSGARVFFLEPA